MFSKNKERQHWTAQFWDFSSDTDNISEDAGNAAGYYQRANKSRDAKHFLPYAKWVEKKGKSTGEEKLVEKAVLLTPYEAKFYDLEHAITSDMV